MARTTFGLVTLFGLCVVAGCSKGSADSSQGTANGSAQVDPATNPVAHAAFDFLDAVIKGDSQRASARLTPLAMKRIIDSGKQFAPPGLDSATFRIGEVRTPSDSQALVQCILTDTSNSSAKSEEMCCLMRRVDNEWRVSGIAYSAGDNRPPMILDFENPQHEQAQQPPTVQQPGLQTSPTSPGRPSPPRTAQEQAPGAIR